MTHYNPVQAREIYIALQKDSSPEFPITAKLVDWIIKDFVYWNYESGTWYEHTIQLSVPGEKLLWETWEDVQKSVQGIFDTTQEKQQIAA